MKKKSTCSYCYGHGIYQSYSKLRWRRVMEAGPNGKPMHPREPVVQCEYCCEPKDAPVRSNDYL
jgi:hypothetical protein